MSISVTINDLSKGWPPHNCEGRTATCCLFVCVFLLVSFQPRVHFPVFEFKMDEIGKIDASWWYQHRESTIFMEGIQMKQLFHAGSMEIGFPWDWISGKYECLHTFRGILFKQYLDLALIRLSWMINCAFVAQKLNGDIQKHVDMHMFGARLRLFCCFHLAMV